MLEEETKEKWILMYVKRWLEAPIVLPDKQVQQRTKGTPQGGVISPLLANIYLHYALDLWLEKEYKGNPYERYADDVIIHCNTETDAKQMAAAIKSRLAKFGLELSEEKTKIVYCKKGRMKDKKEVPQTFTFLGHEFKPKTKVHRIEGHKFLSYHPTVCKAAKKKIHQTLKTYNIQRRTDLSLKQISEMINPKLRGWVNYYGVYGQSDLWYIFRQLNYRILKWWKRKHKVTSIYHALEQVREIQKTQHNLFAHWQKGYLI